MGAGRSKTNQFFNGLIDDLRIYNRVLSADEISTLNNAVPELICNTQQTDSNAVDSIDCQLVNINVNSEIGHNFLSVNFNQNDISRIDVSFYDDRNIAIYQRTFEEDDLNEYLTNLDYPTLDLLSIDIQSVSFDGSFINYSITNAQQENVFVTLFDLNGRVIFSQMHNQQNISHSHPVSNIESGVYLLNIKTAAGTFSEKVLINN